VPIICRLWSPQVSAGGAAQAASQARAAAVVLKAHGVTMTLAPVADVGAAGGGVQDRVFSDDTQAVSRLVSAAVRSYRAAGMIPAVGHFPGQGTASQDPYQGTATVGLSLPDLRRRDLPPFAGVIRDAPAVIVSNAVYAAYDGVTPAALLPNVVTGLLRGNLGFRGVVMTGDLTDAAGVMGQSVGQVAVSAVKAGDDLLYVSGGPTEQAQAFQAVLDALRKGELSRDRVEASVARVIALKQRYGLAVLPPAARKRR
jgi:beta-N-acetylhexosaminidase